MVGDMSTTLAKSSIRKKLIRDRALYLLLLPGILYYILFKYLPMYGILIAFQDYSFGKGIFASQWVGLEHFIKFFSGDKAFILIRNTVLLSVNNLLWGFPAPIILALLLNELKSNRFKRIVQTVSYLPHFISTVIVVGMLVNFVSPSSGIVNVILRRLGHEPIFFMSKPEWFRPLYIGSEIWQQVGWGTILYLAAITGINPELYEASYIDGAKRLQQIRYITIPSIFPVIATLFILNTGRMLTIGAQKVILMYNPLIYETADIIDTYVYRRGILSADFSFAAAVGFFQSLIGLLLVISANKISKRFSETSLW